MRYTARTVYTLAGEPIENGYVDVAPDGTNYRLMMVSAADEQRRILGAYDFKTSKKRP